MIVINLHLREKNMGDQDNKGGLRRQKGWIGFVWGYKDFLEKAPEWDEIKWDKKSKCKEETVSPTGKIIQKW
jgi:hypothetical protein